jgi:hypothetical protein
MTREFIPMTGSLRGQPPILPNLPGNYKLFYAKQTQFLGDSNEHKYCYDKALRQFLSPRTPQKQSQNKPNQTQFLLGLTGAINTCFWLHKDLMSKSLCPKPLSLSYNRLTGSQNKYISA